MNHRCEPPYYPTSITESWTCPDCGTKYAAFDPFVDDLTSSSRWAHHILPNTLGWANYGATS